MTIVRGQLCARRIGFKNLKAKFLCENFPKTKDFALADRTPVFNSPRAYSAERNRSAHNSRTPLFIRLKTVKPYLK